MSTLVGVTIEKYI